MASFQLPVNRWFLIS